MEEIVSIAVKYNLRIVDDACQALGASRLGVMAGKFGILNCFSFNTAKLLGGLCDGGMVTTDSKELYEEICLLRNHYNIHQLSVDRNDYPQPNSFKWAWKSRLSNVNAAFLNVKFSTIDYILNARKTIALAYNDAFKDSPFGLPHDSPGRVWQEYHLHVKERDRFFEHMEKCGVETLTRDTIPNHKMDGLGLARYDLPVTEKLAREVIRLPLHEWLTPEEIGYIITSVRSFYA